MKIRFKIGILIVIVLTVIALAIRGNYIAENYAFSGRIEKLKYEEPKHTPTITVNGVSYTLIVWHTTNGDTLAVGDSIIKRKGTTEYIIKK